MTDYEMIPVPAGKEADFAVSLTDESLLPWVRCGEAVFLQRRTELRDGDVGLFFLGGEMVFRQFCADSRGSVYLFSVNRALRSGDAVLSPAEARELVCYGRCVMPGPVPLPMD